MKRKSTTLPPEARLVQACLEIIATHGYAPAIRAFTTAVEAASHTVRAVDALDVADAARFSRAIELVPPPKGKIQ